MLGVTADQLLDLARDRAGLADFGDEGFLPPFRAMVGAVNAETVFSEEGRERARERFLRLLVNRLRFQADLAKHPEILDEILPPPLIILGLPRTGSTKLHHMLYAGGDFRGLMMWQGYNLAPFPGAPAHGPDPRIDDAAQFLAWRSAKHAAITSAHHAAARELEEEVYLIEMTFHNWAAYGYYRMPSYLDWVRGVDRDDAYRFLRKALQYVQWQHHRGAPARPWILKTPPHLGYEADLLKHFPDARFVMLHRDPLNAVPSMASLTNAMRHQYLADPTEEPIGPWALRQCAELIDRHMEWRARTPEAPVLDLAYTDVVKSEDEVVRRIYAHYGTALTPAVLAAMRAWSSENRQHAHGEHTYSLESTGLNADDILRKFERYRARYAAYLPVD